MGFGVCWAPLTQTALINLLKPLHPLSIGWDRISVALQMNSPFLAYLYSISSQKSQWIRIHLAFLNTDPGDILIALRFVLVASTVTKGRPKTSLWASSASMPCSWKFLSMVVGLSGASHHPLLPPFPSVSLPRALHSHALVQGGRDKGCICLMTHGLCPPWLKGSAPLERSWANAAARHQDPGPCPCSPAEREPGHHPCCPSPAGEHVPTGRSKMPRLALGCWWREVIQVELLPEVLCQGQRRCHGKSPWATDLPAPRPPVDPHASRNKLTLGFFLIGYKGKFSP